MTRADTGGDNRHYVH